ncbi:MAG: alpha/beta fold hydrolase [Gammaproteobacteria bacterium]|nr:MAG: alpha/beta fold hydrolase [Gammaproteobacteria bacterium]
MRTRWKILIAAIVAVPAITLTWFWYWGQQNLARPTQAALAALQSDAEVSVEQDDWLVLRPTAGASRGGVILYPGANCDVRGYAPVLRELARAGYTVVAVPMPFNFAIFAPWRASEVMDDFPGIDRWVLIGHSMGGAMAGYYAHKHPDRLAGVIFWDAYPPESSDLSGLPLTVWSIHRATPDGEMSEKFKPWVKLFPPATRWVPIRGGIHMYFGSFDGGGYVEEWAPQISREEQLARVTRATLAALDEMLGKRGEGRAGAEERT